MVTSVFSKDVIDISICSVQRSQGIGGKPIDFFLMLPVKKSIENSRWCISKNIGVNDIQRCAALVKTIVQRLGFWQRVQIFIHKLHEQQIEAADMLRRTIIMLH